MSALFHTRSASADGPAVPDDRVCFPAGSCPSRSRLAPRRTATSAPRASNASEHAARRPALHTRFSLGLEELDERLRDRGRLPERRRYGHPPGRAAEMADGIPGARLVTVPGAAPSDQRERAAPCGAQAFATTSRTANSRRYTRQREATQLQISVVSAAAHRSRSSRRNTSGLRGSPRSRPRG